MQLHGRKYVRLYDPQQTKHLYRIPAQREGEPGGDGSQRTGGKSGGTAAQGNLSRLGRAVEERGVEERFPAVRQAEYTEAVLGPGDALFIPHGHWHYVRSLETSLSVNFWFWCGALVGLPSEPPARVLRDRDRGRGRYEPTTGTRGTRATCSVSGRPAGVAKRVCK